MSSPYFGQHSCSYGCGDQTLCPSVQTHYVRYVDGKAFTSFLCVVVRLDWSRHMLQCLVIFCMSLDKRLGIPQRRLRENVFFRKIRAHLAPRAALTRTNERENIMTRGARQTDEPARCRRRTREGPQKKCKTNRDVFVLRCL